MVVYRRCQFLNGAFVIKVLFPAGFLPGIKIAQANIDIEAKKDLKGFWIERYPLPNGVGHCNMRIQLAGFSLVFIHGFQAFCVASIIKDRCRRQN